MKTTIALGIVAAVLLVFIVVFERGSVSTRELDARAPAVLAHFVRDKVTKLEIQRQGVTTVLHRAPDTELGFEHGLWKLEAPLTADADQEAVDILLGELEWMDSRRRLKDVSEADRARFGLDKPRYRLWFTVGNQRLLLRVGGETPGGDAVYVEGDRPDTVFVVGKDLPEALDHPPGHYHTKELHDGLVLLTTEQLVLRGEDGELRIAREGMDAKGKGGQFRLQAPVRGLVSRTGLREVVSTLDQLKATRFVAERPEDAERYGFDAPVFEVELRKRSYVEGEKDADGEPRFEQVTWHLRLGGACGEHAGESYLIVDDGPVFCVQDGAIAPARKDATGLRESRLLPLGDDQIARVTLAEQGREVSITAVEADEDGEAGYEVAPHGADAFEAEPQAVRDWFAELRAATAEAYDQGAAEGPVASAERVLTFAREDGPDYVLSVVGGGLVRRGDEPQLTRFSPAAEALLSPPLARFRSRKLFQAEPGALTELEVRRPGGEEHVVRGDDGSLVLRSPALPADAATLQEIARLMAGLEAERFVADQATPAHGLQGSSATRVTARFGDDDSQALVLRIGAEVDTSRYASLSADGPVFVLPSGLSRALSDSLASRGLLALSRGDVRTLELRRGAKRCRLSDAGGTLDVGAGFAGPEQAEAALVALSGLRADAVQRDTETTGPPWAELEVTTADATHRFRIGAVQGEPGRLRYPVVRDDLPLRFEVPEAALAPILACLGPDAGAR